MVFRLKILLIVVGMCISIKSNAQHLQDLWEKTKEYYSDLMFKSNKIVLPNKLNINHRFKLSSNKA